jgi:hypothetical protein
MITMDITQKNFTPKEINPLVSIEEWEDDVWNAILIRTVLPQEKLQKNNAIMRNLQGIR